MQNVTLPMEVIVGKPSTQPKDDDLDDYVPKLQNRMKQAHYEARKHLKSNSHYQKRHYVIRAKKVTLNVGQAVWLYDNSRKVGVCQKLTSKWKGPYLVTKKINDTTYFVKRSPKLPSKAYHIDRLMPYGGMHRPAWFAKVLNTTL